MSEKIEPALSAEEWADGYHSTDLDIVRHRVGLAGNRRIDLTVRAMPLDDPRDFAALIAAFNDALDDSDPRKITREILDALRYAANYADSADREGLLAFAAALESYLPPEEM